MSERWGPERVAVEREKWARRVEETGTGVPCSECGYDGTNIVHDPPWYRADNDYYREFPDTENHEFVGDRRQPETRRQPQSNWGIAYRRGYQAGYHAGRRDAAFHPADKGG